VATGATDGEAVKVVSLRAPSEGSAPIVLHSRLTVITGVTDLDRELLRAAFGALTGGDSPELEVTVEIGGVAVVVGDGFAASHGLQSAPSTFVTVPPATALASTRSELRQRALELVPRLESLAERRGLAQQQQRALERLMGECRVAIDSARRCLAVGSADETDPYRVAALERLRDQMLDLATSGRMTRRRQRALGSLQTREQELLAEMGHTSRASLLASRVSAGTDDPSRFDRSEIEARLDLLEELQSYWESRRALFVQEQTDEALARAEAEELLDGSERAGRQQNSRLAAANLRHVFATGNGLFGSEASWSLAEELELRRSVADVGSLPTLVEEPTGERSALHDHDPLSVAALAALVQVVWITERHDVVRAMDDVGDLATVISV